MKKMMILFAVMQLFFWTGCSFGGNGGESKTYDPDLKIEKLEASQQTIVYKDQDGQLNEVAQIVISWTVSKKFEIMEFREKENDYFKKVSSSYKGIKVNAAFDNSLTFEITPTTSETYGYTYIYHYTPEKNKLDSISGTPLADGVQEIDCTMDAGDYKVFELENASVKFLNAKDATVYFARFNPSEDKTLKSNRGAHLSSSQESKPLNFGKINRGIVSEADFFESADVLLGLQILKGSKKENRKYDLIEIETADGVEMIKRVHPEIHVDESSFSYPESMTRSDETNVKYPLEFNVGDRKTVYCAMIDSDINHNIVEAEAILQYKSEGCYVWAVDKYFTEGRPGNGKVNREICETIGKTFDIVSDLERNIFGQEFEFLRSVDDKFDLPMESFSETGTVVNILLYDIANDYVDGSAAGTFGFFTSGDYSLKESKYNSTAISNGGKYIHMDSGYSSNEKTFPVVLSTVVHEFQHMIHMGQKKLYQRSDAGASSVYFNEMCSTLAEDLFQTKLNLSDMDCGKYRFMHFIYSWDVLPMFKWDNTDFAYSYSNGFGMGSLFAKKYGGADFIYEYMHRLNYNEYRYSDYWDFFDTIKAHDPSLTEESLFLDFCVELCTGRTYNTEVRSTEHVMNGYDYPMTKFDLKNYSVKSNDKVFTGPIYTKLEGDTKDFEWAKVDVSRIVEITGDSDTVDFYGTSEDGLKEYIIVTK